VSTVNLVRISEVHILDTVQMKEDAREFTVVDIVTILGRRTLSQTGIDAGLSIAVSI